MRKAFIIGLVLCLLPGMVFTGEKNAPSPSAHAKTFPAHLTQEDITLAVVPYLDSDEVKKTFDKALVEHQIVPVKVIISNDRREAVRIEGSSIRLIDQQDNQYRPLTAKEILQRIGKPKRKSIRVPVPNPLPRSSGPNKKLGELELLLESRELGRRVVPPNATDYGFVFFTTDGGSVSWAKSRIYIPEVANLKGERSMFFEIDFVLK
jgi:hypothetical protein